jgi:gluconate 2-dehydrogenase gamma chain
MVDPSHSNSKSLTRRVFISAIGKRAVGASIALQLPWLATLAGCERDQTRNATFQISELRTLRAFGAQIIPSESDSIGALEAGAAEYIDRALTRPLYSMSAPMMRAGLADLDVRVRKSTAASHFASASSAEQIAIMHDIASTPFFALARTLIVVGTFADPSHGGNRNASAWSMIGMEHRPSYSPPYGWYDATEMTKAS